MSPHCVLCSKGAYYRMQQRREDFCTRNERRKESSEGTIIRRLRLLQISLGKPTTVHSGGARYYYQRQKRDDCEAILRIGRFPSPRFVGQPELSPPPQKRRNGFPSKAAALKVPLHTARTVKDVVAACLDLFSLASLEFEVAACVHFLLSITSS